MEDHPSPYLALHGTDPVAWQRWDEAVFERARAENKLIYVSSGYFSCHWCHVMQAESYKDDAIAAQLNAAFIPVKVDRELEPALDQRLIEFAQATLGRAGWPLNVFLTPEGAPVLAVLYRPRDDFERVLFAVEQSWHKNSETIREVVSKERLPQQFEAQKPELDATEIKQWFAEASTAILARGDTLEGGFGASNKFPSVPQLSLLLESFKQTQDTEVEAFLRLTLDAMANLGMRDHLSGGFFRYVVDPSWSIPHFEKMLYDNANLALLYLHAGQQLQSEAYLAVARQTLDFMRSAMWDEQHGALVSSFSAVDADEVEGGYYLWQEDQLKAILSKEELAVVTKFWSLDRPADLSAGNHLRDAKPLAEVAETLQMPSAVVARLFEKAVKTMNDTRNNRQLPVDDKLLAAWNGLALRAYSEAAEVFDHTHYRQTADALWRFTTKVLWDGKSMIRALAKGQLIGTASLADYAQMAAGWAAYAKLTQQPEHWVGLDKLLNQAWRRFYRYNGWQSADFTLLPPADGVEVMPDSTTTSPAAVLMQTTQEFARLNDDTALQHQVLSALNKGGGAVQQSPFWSAGHLLALRAAVGNGD